MHYFEDKVYFIYDCNDLVYIGLTINLKLRIQQHLRANSDIGRYISDIKSKGRSPIFFEYENKENYNPSLLEMVFINSLKPIVNLRFKHELLGLDKNNMNKYKFKKSQLIPLQL